MLDLCLNYFILTFVSYFSHFYWIFSMVNFFFIILFFRCTTVSCWVPGSLMSHIRDCPSLQDGTNVSLWCLPGDNVSVWCLPGDNISLWCLPGDNVSLWCLPGDNVSVWCLPGDNISLWCLPGDNVSLWCLPGDYVSLWCLQGENVFQQSQKIWVKIT